VVLKFVSKHWFHGLRKRVQFCRMRWRWWKVMCS
jgi:hypothetical protein